MRQLTIDLLVENAHTPRVQNFRLIHYLGSKARLIEAIHTVIDSLADRRLAACDLFSGSGIVSSALAESRFVMAVDIQEYARVLAAALLHPEKVPTSAFEPLFSDFEKDEIRGELLHCYAPLLALERDSIEEARNGSPGRLADLIEAGSVISLQIDGSTEISDSVLSSFTETLRRLRNANLDQSHLSTTSRYFGGLFFGFRQAIDLDSILNRLDILPVEIHDLGKAAALSTASKVTATIGNQFAQPLRPRNRLGEPKPGLWKRIANSTSVDTINAYQNSLRAILDQVPKRCGGIALRSDYREFLSSCSEPIGVFYADPPYTRDHYSRFYHVLETLCLRDNPDVSRTNLKGGTRISRGAYRQDRHQSPFCIRSKAREAFEELFRKCRKFDAPVVLSYSPPHDGNERSHPRVMRTDDIERIAKRFYSTVELLTVEDVAHSKFTKSELHLETPELAEILMVCRP